MVANEPKRRRGTDDSRQTGTSVRSSDPARDHWQRHDSQPARHDNARGHGAGDEQRPRRGVGLGGRAF
jgi:hypothetical protein